MIDQNPNLVNSSLPKKKKWYLKWWVIIIFIVIFFSLVLITAMSFQAYDILSKLEEGEMSKETALKIREELEKGIEIVDVSIDDDPSRGSSDAKVTIIAFEDFECPVCRQSFPIVQEIISTYGNQIYFVYRDFPITDVHPNAQKAHESAECADDQGGFWPMHDKIYLNQNNITVPDLKRYATEIGLDVNAFSLCLDNGKYEKEIMKDLTDGIYYGVQGTPTWFINGRKFEGAISEDLFKGIIEVYLLTEQ